MKKVRIIIPAYNEENRIARTLDNYCSFFKKAEKNGIKAEIYIVINNTRDRTPEIVKNFMKKFKNLKFIDIKDKGKGLTIIRGFRDSLEAGNFELIGFVDADMATEAQDFYDLIINIDNYDGIIASRWMNGSVVEHKDSVIRKIYSAGFNLLARMILGLNYKDTQCGAKLFKKEALEKIINQLGITQWAFDIDILYKMKLQNLQVKEIPTHWRDMAGSKVKNSTAVQMFFALIRIRLLNSWLKDMVRAYDLLPNYLKIHRAFK